MSSHYEHGSNSSTEELIKIGIGTPLHITEAMAEANKCFHALQVETAYTMFAENTRQFKVFLNGAAETAIALTQWPMGFYEKAQGLANVARGWFELASQGIVQMNQLMVQSLAASTPIAPGDMASEQSVFPERRVTAMVISFADRRAAAKEVSAELGGRRQAGKKRSAA